jgi:glycosyltransferase involved in cell wall biosynthesis/SAM-dependent methyltransferase
MAQERLVFEGPDATYHSYHAAQHLVRYAAARPFCTGRRVLDVACGQGFGTKLLVEWGASEVVGVDISEEAIGTARRIFGHDKIRFLVGDAHSVERVLDSKDRFDLIVSLETIEHLRRPDQFLAGIKRLLSDGGAIVISCPNDLASYTEGQKNEFHLARYSFDDFKRLTEGVLGSASVWLLGTPLLGELNYICGSPIVENDHPQALSLMNFEDISHCALLPSQSNLRNSPGLASHYLGIWGARGEANAVVSGISLPAFMEPWRVIDALRSSQRDLQLSLAAKDEVLAAKNVALAAKDETLANLETLLTAQENELQIFRTSKLQRLRSAILYEKLSAQKIAKITYLIAGLTAPERVRRRLRPLLPRWKRAFESATKPRPKIERRTQEEWPADRPLLSVIIPCFNYGHYVEEAVGSVLSQTFQDFEIIVVDGGSTDDDTLRVLKSLKKSKTKVYLRAGRHLAGDNRNFGISHARGKYICCLDADDRLKASYLEKALFLLETYRYELVSSSVEWFGARHCIFEVAAKPSLEQIIISNQFSTTAVFSRALWEKAGGYHDWGLGKAYIAEDWDLWLRMMALGARVINIPEALMLYRVHDASLTKQAEVRSWEEQGKEILKFNKEHLKRKNYLLSAKRNAAIVQVEDPNLNLVTSYQKAAKKPAILFALPYVITGGADTVFLDIAEHLTSNGFDLSVVTTQPVDSRFGDNTEKYEALTSAQVYHLYQFLAGENKWRDFLFYLIETRNIGILLLAGSAYVYKLLPEIKQRFPQLKIVDQLFNEFGHMENNRKYSDYIDFHIVANEVIKDILVKAHGEKEDKVRVIVHGVDVEGRFNPGKVEVGAETRAVVPQGKFLVSFIGRFSEEKCPKKFVEMVNLLKNEDNLHFLMIGNGPEYPYIKQRIKELQLDNKIYAPGIVPDPRPFLKASGVVVIPSTIEGIPILLMESLAVGVPVIASAVGGIPSIIQDGFNGFICEPSDIEAFVRAIRKVAGDESLRNAMRANARKFALQHLDVSGMKNDYRNVFVELLAEKRTQEKWPEDGPLVSVVIPSFNYGRYLEETIDSILGQTFQDFEIIVTDGGSTDEDTLHLLRSLQRPKTTVYLNEGRHLLGDNRNLGIARARGKYICCLDSDDKLKPTYLEKALFLLETYNYDIVSTSVQCFGGSNGVWQVAISPTLEQVTYANQFAVVAVFRRDLWEKAQGYRDRGLGKELVAEDWDLWVRMMGLGARATNIPEALMLYRVHDASLSKQAEVRSWEEQGKEMLKFNQEHLKRKNYLLSAKRNAAIVQVEDPYLNLVTSYQKAARKPAILFALPYVITDGADTVFLDIAEQLTANGFDLSLVTTQPVDSHFGGNTAKYEAITSQVYDLSQFLPEKSKWKDFLFYLIETRNIGILLLAGSAYVYRLLPEIKQRFPQLKIVDQLFNEFGDIEKNRRYSTLIDFHVVANEATKEILVKRHGEKEDKIRVLVQGYSNIFAEFLGAEYRQAVVWRTQDRADTAVGP